MINYVIAEAYRILQKRSLILFLLIVFLADSLVIMFLNKIGAVESVQTMITENIIVGNGIIVYAFYPIDAIWIDEFKNKTIKNTLSYGISKKTIFISKSIATVLFTLGFNLIESIYCIVIQLTIYTTKGEVHGEFLFDLLIKFLTSIPLIISVTLFGIILTLLVKKISWVIVICLSGFILIEYNYEFGTIKGNHIIEVIYKLMPDANLNLIAIGSQYGGKISLNPLNIYDIGTFLLLGGVYTVIFACIGYIIYDKVSI